MKKTFFVCSSIIANDLINRIINAETQEEASLIFFDEFLEPPKQILGPFLFKKIKNPNMTLKFLNQTKKAYYNGWLVNAFLLKEPQNCSFLIFIKSSDQNAVPPKGNTIVHNSQLRFLDG